MTKMVITMMRPTITTDTTSMQMARITQNTKQKCAEILQLMGTATSKAVLSLTPKRSSESQSSPRHISMMISLRTH